MRLTRIVAVLLAAGAAALAAHQFPRRSTNGSIHPVELRDFLQRLRLESSVPRDQSGVYDLGDVALLDNGKAWAVGYDGKHTDRIYRSEDGGKTWQSMDVRGTGFTFKALTFIDAEHGWAVGGNGLLIRTTNSGDSWELLTPPTGHELHTVHFANSRIGYLAGRDGILNSITREVKGSVQILCTKDGGDSWRVCYRENEPLSVFQIMSTSESTAFAVVGGNRLLRTDNQGRNWREVPLSVKYVSSIAFGTDGTGWLVGSHGAFQTSSDGGKTWHKPASLPQDFVNRDWWEVVFNSNSMGLAVGDNSTLALTIDNGKSWELQNLHISDHLRAVRMTDSHAIILGSQNVYSLCLPE